MKALQRLCRPVDGEGVKVAVGKVQKIDDFLFSIFIHHEALTHTLAASTASVKNRTN